MVQDNDKELQERLVVLLRETLNRDGELREKYEIGQKFRFVEDRLKALLHKAEQDLPQTNENEDQKDKNLLVNPDEVMIYVHLYNAKGNILRNWQGMLTPKVFYEYSVNRPIYLEKAHIESLLRSKPNKAQHAYLVMIVKKEDITQPVVGAIRKDVLGNPLVKIKEGALKFERLIAFFHNEQEYVLNSQGELTKKESSHKPSLM